MPTKKEIENAWNAHDSTHEKDCEQRPGWNTELGHSRFNPACKLWVEDYAKAHPISRIAPPPSKKKPQPRYKCVQCGRERKQSRMLKLEMTYIPDELINAEILDMMKQRKTDTLPKEEYEQIRNQVETKYRKEIKEWVCSKRCAERRSAQIMKEGPE